jgi:hypothetical protein
MLSTLLTYLQSLIVTYVDWNSEGSNLMMVSH